jgi:hypothetical protein
MEKIMDEMIMISSFHGQAKQGITQLLADRGIAYQTTDIVGYSPSQGFNLWTLEKDKDSLDGIETLHAAYF